MLSAGAAVYFARRPKTSGTPSNGTGSGSVPQVDDTSPQDDATSIAFVGNSMFYFNDFPRFFQQLAAFNNIKQDSCLLGGATLEILAKRGSGMYPQFETQTAKLPMTYNNETMYDYGACTVPQLLLGNDLALEDANFTSEDYNTPTTNRHRNPCRVDNNYRLFTLDKQHPVKWDYVIMNDNTRNPARETPRISSLLALKDYYIPWLLETGAIPVFVWTHAYIPANGRDMQGLEDVANFTSLTGVGLREYSALLQEYLPLSQPPRIAPVGLAFLTIYEEEREIWKTLFHNADHKHPSPSGTFLQGCIVYNTLFGRLPDISFLKSNDDIVNLWKNARMMQHVWEPPNPLPTLEEVRYLFSIAERIATGYVPTTYINYENGETAYEGN